MARMRFMYIERIILVVYRFQSEVQNYKYWYSSKHCFSSFAVVLVAGGFVLSGIKQDAQHC